LTGALLSIAGAYDLLVTPLKTSATTYKILMTAMSLATAFIAFVAYLSVAKAPEELPDTPSVCLVIASFLASVACATASVWSAAKG
jgi:hypothetical protein